MKFLHLEYLPFILIFILVFATLIFFLEKKFFTFIKTYWFYKRSFLSFCSTLVFLLSLLVMLVTLLDLRGPEKKIEANVPLQKTIILLDNSQSMLVEDVRPDRFTRSIFLARHFIRHATGHQISVLLFSDTHKKIVPFTTDIELIDSRLSSLVKFSGQRGGSNLKQAISEAVQYFNASSKDFSELTGNILIFTDGEETYAGMKLSVPDNISVGVVGIGTQNGGPIPNRTKKGVFYGNKTYNGQEVISKLDESFLKFLGQEIKKYNYWLASSTYNLPTKDILKFFDHFHFKKYSFSEVTIRPVLMEYILIPGIILYILSVLLGIGKTFKYGQNIILLLGLFVGLTWSRNSYTQEQKMTPEQQKKAKEFLAKIRPYLSELKKGKLDRDKKLDLAHLLLKGNMNDEAIKIYEEAGLNKSFPENDIESYFSYGTALLKKGEIKKGVDVYNHLEEKLSDSENFETLKKHMRNNLLKALKKKKEQKNQQNKNDQNKKDQKNKKDKENKKQNQESKENQEKKEDQKQNQDENKKDKQDKEQQQKDDKKSSGDQEQKDKNKDLKEDQGKEKKEKKDQQSQGEQDKKDQKKNAEQKKGQAEERKKDDKDKKKLKVKIPALLKQLVNEDQKLQGQYLDTRTQKGQKNKLKDW